MQSGLVALLLLLTGCSDGEKEPDAPADPASDTASPGSTGDSASETDDPGGPDPLEDADGDGYTAADNDCDDSDPAVLPVVFEDSSGAITDLSPDFAGTALEPARVAVSSPGILRFCEGEWYTHITIDTDNVYIIGRGEGTVLNGADKGTVISAREVQWLRISDLTVAHGAAEDGGGMVLSGGGVELTDVLFLENAATGADSYGDGGGLFAEDSEVTLTRTTFEANTGGYGGGAYLQNCQVLLTDAVFRDNECDRYGGGLRLYRGSALLEGVSFLGNRAGAYGGGAYIEGDSMTLRDVTASGNEAEDGGGGLYLESDSSPVIVEDSTITDNISAHSGGGLGLFPGTRASLTDTVVSGNEAEDGGGLQTWSDGQLDWIGGELTGNTATLMGGGMRVIEGGVAHLEGVTVSGNAGGMGGAFYLDEGLLEITDCDLLDNDPADLYHGVLRREYDWSASGVTLLCTEEGCFSAADGDGDTYSELDGDCDDADAAVHPGAAEVCDGVDNDCDALLDGDDDSVDWSTVGDWYRDADGDGYGDASASSTTCSQPDGYIRDGGDTDDTDPLAYPGSEEVDDDGDGYTDGEGDSDDGDPNVYPGAPEVCDGVQNDSDAASWHASEEAGMATFFDADGAATDWTAALTGPGVSAATVSEPGALWICEGDWSAALTIEADDVRVMGSGEGLTVLDGERSEVVITAYGVSGLHLEGLSITRGDSAGLGGGVALTLVEGSLVNVSVTDSSAADGCGVGAEASVLHFEGITLSDNLCGDGWGGGLYLKSTIAALLDAVITGNSAMLGGGISAHDSALTLSDATLSDNDCSSDATCLGGGLMVLESEVTLSDTTFSDNDVDGDGGGLYVMYNGTLTLTDVLFSNNSARDNGGGFTSASSEAAFLRVDFDGNSSGSHGGGMYLWNDTVIGEDCDFADNDPEDLYETSSGAYTLGLGADFECDSTGC